MVHLFGLLMLAACCALAGMAASRTLSRRVEELEAAIGMTGQMAGQLRYTLAPMDQVVRRLATLPDALPLLGCCVRRCKEGEPFPRAWRQAVEECSGALLSEDRQILLHMGAVLGAVDLDGALGELEYARFALKERYGEALERQKKLGGLYKTLGMLAGAGVVVVLL